MPFGGSLCLARERSFVVCTRTGEHGARGGPILTIWLHANATMTSRTRSYIQSTDKGIRPLADELGISVSTAHHWRNRDMMLHGKHTRENPLAALNPAPEAIVIELRHTLLLPLHVLLVVVHEFIHPNSSRSALVGCPRRNSVPRLADTRRAESSAAVKAKSFKVHGPGLLPADHRYDGAP